MCRAPGSGRVRPCVALLILALVATPAVAQSSFVPTSVEASVTPFGAPLEPGSAETSGEVRYTVSGSAPAAGPVRITIEVAEAPEWAVIEVDPAETTVDVPAEPALADRTFVVPFRVTIHVADAPAFQPAVITLRIAAHESPPYMASDGEATFEVEATYVHGYTVEVVDADVTLRPVIDPPAFGTIAIANRANGPTRFDFEVATAAEGVDTLVPGPLVFESAATGGTYTSGNAIVHFAPAPRIDAPVDVEVRVSAAYALDPSVERPPPATVRFRVLPFVAEPADDRDAPLPLGAAVVGLALAAAWSPHRRRA